MIAPVAPKAWPMAIVPPWGFIRSGPTARSRRNRRHRAAKASANSNTSTSSAVSPARRQHPLDRELAGGEHDDGVNRRSRRGHHSGPRLDPEGPGGRLVPHQEQPRAVGHLRGRPTVCRCADGPTSGCFAATRASCPAAPTSAKAGGSSARVAGSPGRDELVAHHHLHPGRRSPPAGAPRRDRRHLPPTPRGPWCGS